MVFIIQVDLVRSIVQKRKGLQVVTDAMKIYPYLGEQYFVAAEQIATNYGGKDANGKVVDLDQIREDGKKNIYRKRIRSMMEQLC